MSKKVALVTGGASGIGFASAEVLGSDGYHVVLIDVREEAVAASAQALQRSDIAATALVVDLAQPSEIQSIPSKLGALLDRTAVLVNSAAISPKRNGKKIPVVETSLDDWERTLRVNLTAPLLLSQIALGPMRANKWGRILNISSRAGRMPSGQPGIGYVTTKTAILGLTRAIAQEVAVDGITVNSIAPGRIRTAMGENLDAESMQRILDDIPVKRWGEPAEIAALVRFLASDAAGYITGAVVDINGGVVMM